MEKSHGFTISSENPDFLRKRQDVFSCIDSSASNLISSDSAIESDEDSRDVEGDVIIQVSSKKKISRKPIKKEIKLPEKPDYVVNPSRYTKYSLEDTELGDNRCNAQIAFQFLQELEDRKIPESESKTEVQLENKDDSIAKQHVFNMPENANRSTKKDSQKSVSETISETMDGPSCNKVELEHLEENISAAEFTSTIAAKLEESLVKINPELGDNSIAEQSLLSSDKHQFKSVTKKNRIHFRGKSHDDNL